MLYVGNITLLAQNHWSYHHDFHFFLFSQTLDRLANKAMFLNSMAWYWYMVKLLLTFSISNIFPVLRVHKSTEMVHPQRTGVLNMSKIDQYKKGQILSASIPKQSWCR